MEEPLVYLYLKNIDLEVVILLGKKALFNIKGVSFALFFNMPITFRINFILGITKYYLINLLQYYLSN